MIDIDELLCRFSDGNISTEERKEVFSYLAEHPEKERELHAIISGSNVYNADFEDVEIPIENHFSVISSAATFAASGSTVVRKQRYSNVGKRCSLRVKINELLDDISRLD